MKAQYVITAIMLAEVIDEIKRRINFNINKNLSDQEEILEMIQEMEIPAKELYQLIHNTKTQNYGMGSSTNTTH